MKLQPVNSSSVTECGYDPARKTLAVRFKNGGLYHYHDVSQQDYAKLTSAKSFGAHLQAHIVGKFEHTAVGDRG